MSRFDYVKYDDAKLNTSTWFKDICINLEKEIEALIECSRSKALALTKLEEVYMWIGKGIRNDQINKNGSAPLQEERCDS